MRAKGAATLSSSVQQVLGHRPKDIDYQFIQECWAGLHAPAINSRKEAWLARHLVNGGIAKSDKFRPAQNLFIFKMKNGKSKISWGVDANDAMKILKLRLTDQEMAEIDFDQCKKIQQQKLPSIVADLG